MFSLVGALFLVLSPSQKSDLGQSMLQQKRLQIFQIGENNENQVRWVFLEEEQNQVKGIFRWGPDTSFHPFYSGPIIVLRFNE